MAAVYFANRVAEATLHIKGIYEYANSFQVFSFLFASVYSMYEKIGQLEQSIIKCSGIYVFIALAWAYSSWVYSIVTFEAIFHDEVTSIPEKKIIVGWNMLTHRPKSGTSNIARGSTNRLGITVKTDIEEFRRAVLAREIGLQLITVSSFMIDECLSDQSDIDNFVEAARRRLPPGDYSDEREDFMIIFDNAEHSSTHIFKCFSHTHQTYYRFASKLFFMGLLVFFLIPENEDALPKWLCPYFPYLSSTQGWLYFVWTFNIGLYLLLSGYNLFLAKLPRYFPKYNPEDLGSKLLDLIPGVGLAHKVSQERQKLVQSNVFRDILNKLSENLRSSVTRDNPVSPLLHRRRSRETVDRERSALRRLHILPRRQR